MKLGSLKSGRDGRLAVVSRGLSRAIFADTVAPTLQAALDRWADAAPRLEELAHALEAGTAKDSFALDPAKLAAPLPRAYQWCDGSAYLHHVELVRRARNAEMPPSFYTDPLMYQGGSDSFIGPLDDVPLGSEDWGIDFEAEVAVITDDVPMGVAPSAARGHIKLVLLVNDVSLRNLIPNELAKGFGFFHGKPSSAFSPVAVTPDEFGAAWTGAKVHLPLVVHLNGTPFGRPNAGADMNFDFGQLVAHAAKTRPLGAGTVIGAGTVSNKDRAVGSCCLAEVRVLEQLDGGKPRTPFMRFGDRVRIEMLDAEGRSICGAIDQKIVKYTPAG